MKETVFLVLSRLRRPIIVVITSLAISVFGLANIQGIDADGNPGTLGYFYAFYIMSYTATTIGFGEIPFEFSNAQRAWITLSIYISVICWAYGLGVVLQMIRDPVFRQALVRGQFAARVRRLTEPFILIIGYGRSGTVLAHMLDRIGYRSIIIEIDADRATQIRTQEFQNYPLSLNADGRWPDVLVDAGVTHSQCQAMVVIAGDDDTTQSVAISGNALSPNLRIIARARSEIAEANLEPFAKIEIINPFETFALNLGKDFNSPDKLRLEEWLTGFPGETRPDILRIPSGHWVICGFGRFGRYIAKALTRGGATWTAIDPDPPEFSKEKNLIKKMYSQDTIMEAGIENAVGIIACTDSDSVNLAAIRRARILNPDLFVAMRQVLASNDSLVEATHPNLRFNQADVMSHEVRQLITSPLLNRFLAAIRNDSGDLSARTASLLENAVGDRVPFLWVFSAMGAYPGLREAFAWNPESPFKIDDLLVHPNDPVQYLSAAPLMLVRESHEILLPEGHTKLLSGDRILFAGNKAARDLQRLHLLSPSPLPLIRTGVEPPRSWVFRKWFESRNAK
ncbi:MAG: NAD-binding protein [Burkholderiales bacterium]|jgi:Trk K+ transport system NAD-binding subunit|nr:NAD-binding protein [Burkholderiales bacterium]